MDLEQKSNTTIFAPNRRRTGISIQMGLVNCPIRANCFENALKQMFQRSFSAKVKIGSKLLAFKRSE